MKSDDADCRKIIIATNNPGKVREIKQILAPLGFAAVSLADEGIEIDIVEDGETFAENAHIKAKTIFSMTGLPVIADDSGLEVEFLNGAPGVFSARYGGEDLSDMDRCRLILDELQGVDKPLRAARFVGVIYCMIDEKTEFCATGVLEGFIGDEPVGENGFGYDPIFMVNDRESMAMLDDEKKNKISHRGNALRGLEVELRQNLT